MIDAEITPMPEPQVPDMRISTFVDTMSDINICPRHLLPILLGEGGVVEQCDPIYISSGLAGLPRVETHEAIRLRFTLIGWAN